MQPGGGEAGLGEVAERVGPSFAAITAEDVVANLGGLVSEVDRSAITGASAGWLAESFRVSVRNGMAGWIDDEARIRPAMGLATGMLMSATWSRGCRIG